MDIWVVSNFLDRIYNAVILSTASKQLFMTLLLCSRRWNEQGGWTACRSLGRLPAATSPLFTSWCTATNRPGPPFVGLASLRRPTLQSCPSRWWCNSRGSSVESGWRWWPHAWHPGNIGNDLVQAGPAPSRCDPDHLVCLGLAFQPNHEERDKKWLLPLQWGELKAGQLPPSPSKNWI